MTNQKHIDMVKNTRSSIDNMLIGISYLLSPLKHLDNKERVFGLMCDLGWKLPATNLFQNGFTSIISRVNDLILNIYELADASGSDYFNLITTIKESIEAVVGIINDANGLRNDIQLGLAGYKNFLDGSGIITEKLPNRLIDYLLVVYLQNQQAKLYGILNFLGIVEICEETAETDYEILPKNSTYPLRKVNWDRIPDFLTDPISLADKAYNWNSDPKKSFAAHLFLSRLETLMRGFLIPGGLYKQDPTISTALSFPAAYLEELRIPIFQTGAWPDTYAEAGLNITTLPDVINDKGFALIPYVVGGLTLKIDLTDTLEMDISGVVGLDKGIGIIVRPPKEIEITPNLFSGNNVPAEYNIKVILQEKDGLDNELVLFGSPDASYFSIKGFSLLFEASKNGQAQDIVIEFGINRISLVIARGDGDGFLQKILPEYPIKLESNITLGWSRNKGIYFNAAAALELTININKSFGPIFISLINLKIGIENKTITLITVVSGSASIGPVCVSVEKIGLKTDLLLGKPGVLGKADLKFGFKPPDGIGLAISSEIIKGGGYLQIDNGNYFGAIALSIENKIFIQGVGAIITRRADGTETFSFKLLGRADFDACPIQIGMGFCIIGFGCLIAIDCTMNLDFLRASVYAGNLKSTLFPDDLIQNAPAVIAGLNEAFPDCKDSYVFGALARIEWGSGLPIFVAELAIIMEFGNKIRIALAGIATIQLPNASSPIVKIQLQILGIIDFSAKSLSIDAKLVDSYITSFTLEGESALRCNWGEHPRFAFSAGGFHPAYNPPNDFPALQRMSLIISKGNPNIVFLSYLAITENSCQFGASLIFYWYKNIDLWFTTVKIELSGTAGFDVLIIFEPFHFIASIYATFDLKVNGDSYLSLDFDLNLEGPNNYHIWGKFSVSIWKFSVSLSIDHEFGDKTEEIEATCNPIAILKQEVIDSANWVFLNKNGYAQGVILKDTTDGLVQSKIDPLSNYIEFSQKTVPFVQNISRIGKSKLGTPGNYNISHLTVRDQESTLNRITGKFSPGDYFEFNSDDDKLAQPPYLDFEAGVSLIWDKVECSENVEISTGIYERHLPSDLVGGKVAIQNYSVKKNEKLLSAVKRTGIRRNTHTPLLLEK